MGLIDQLKNCLGFTNSEKAVIDLILQNPDLLKKSTTRELASAANVSASTVTRLCQKIGCKNYDEFRLRFVAEQENRAVNGELIDASFPFQKNDNPREILEKITDLQSHAVRETLSLIDMDVYNRVIRMLNKADSIDIYGMGTNMSIAQDFTYKMTRICHTVQFFADEQHQILASALARKNHCAIVISYSGETNIAVACAKALWLNRIPIITITKLGNNSVSKYATERLYVTSQEENYAKIGAFSSGFSLMTILNYLFAGVFNLDYDKNHANLIKAVSNSGSYFWNE